MLLGNIPPPYADLTTENTGREPRPRSPLNIKRALRSWRSEKAIGGTFLLKPKKSIGSLRLATYPSNTPSTTSQLSALSMRSAATSPPVTMAVSSKPGKRRKNSLSQAMMTALNSALPQNASKAATSPSPITRFASSSSSMSPPLSEISHNPSIDIAPINSRESCLILDVESTNM